LLGVLSVLHDQKDAFTEDHLALMQAICQQTSLALGNASRYRQIERLASLLSTEQQRLGSLIEYLPVGVLLLDSEQRLLVSNPIGRTILTDLNGELDEHVITHIGPHSLESLCTNFGESMPVEIVRENLPRRFFEIEARQVGDTDRNWVLMLREVTQERENQARIQMQERLATVGQLAAGIAHDFNNIMAAILVYTDLLIREPNLSSASLERLAIIQKQVDRAASLIRQILDFSRRSVMEQSPLDLLPFIKELDKLFARIMPENIRLALNYLPGTYRVDADPTRLQQVFMNLVLNARDAMPQGGILTFELSSLRLEIGEPAPIPGMPIGEWVHIVVSDTGAGISEDVLSHIFEPFYTTKPVGQGTGLGLAQVYGIIKQHGGFIDVNSQDGVGTSFEIYLPALPEPHKVEDLQKIPDAFEGAGETLLLVEDDQTTRQALQTLLETQNYHVLTASDGLEALRFYDAAAGSISLVISDLIMPHMGGVELYYALQQRWPDVKMLFITGHPLDEESRALLERGGVHWMQKPFSIQELGQAMKSILQPEV
jgi:signal transduction histidine kinase/CheY-like chemotaxis protein